MHIKKLIKSYTNIKSNFNTHSRLFLENKTSTTSGSKPKVSLFKILHNLQIEKLALDRSFFTERILLIERLNIIGFLHLYGET